MSGISKFKVRKCTRKGENGEGWYKTQITFEDIVINNKSAYELLCEKGLDLVSCLGWLSPEFQKKQIDKLLLKGSMDFPDNRYAIYICPECGDLGCGAISVNIERQGNVIVWKDFGYENDWGYENGLGGVNLSGYEDLGQFYFDAEDYENELNKLYNAAYTKVN